MNFKDMQKYMGLHFWSPPANGAGDPFNEEIKVKVEVEDVRSQFGRVDCLIRPIEGKGQRWVGASTLTNLSEHMNELPA